MDYDESVSENNEPDSEMQHDLLAFDPDYWENQAQSRRKQADAFRAFPQFAKVLHRHAEEFDALARVAFKLRQQRRLLMGIEPTNRPKVAAVVDMTTSIRRKTGDGAP